MKKLLLTLIMAAFVALSGCSTTEWVRYHMTDSIDVKRVKDMFNLLDTASEQLRNRLQEKVYEKIERYRETEEYKRLKEASRLIKDAREVLSTVEIVEDPEDPG